MGEVIEEKLKPVNLRLDNIDLKLHNHLEHNALQVGGIMADIRWLKEFTEKKIGGPNDTGVNASQTTNIEWLKWGFRLIVSTLIVNIIGIAFLIVRFLIK